jgi:hypothetical protein
MQLERTEASSVAVHLMRRRLGNHLHVVLDPCRCHLQFVIVTPVEARQILAWGLCAKSLIRR